MANVLGKVSAKYKMIFFQTKHFYEVTLLSVLSLVEMFICTVSCTTFLKLAWKVSFTCDATTWGFFFFFFHSVFFFLLEAVPKYKILVVRKKLQPDCGGQMATFGV